MLRKIIRLYEQFEQGRAQTEKLIDTFETELTQWGRSAIPRIGTEYPALSPSIPYPFDDSKQQIKPMPEARFMAFEKHILIMRKLTPDLYAILLAKYAYKLPLRNEYDKHRNLVKHGILDIFDISKDEYAKTLRTAKTALRLMLEEGKVLFNA